MSKATKILIGLVVVVALAVGGFLVWFYAIKADAPAKFDATSLNSALATTTTVQSGSSATPDPTGTQASTTAPAGIDGTWTISAGSSLGYRVRETLAGLDTVGAGRTDKVTGSMTIGGGSATAAQFTVDVASITSDDSRRDRQFKGPIMDTDKFPTATFELSAPIAIGAIPADGALLTLPASGELTMHGVTKPVTFEVQAKLSGGRIGVLGSIPITFADFDIANPSNSLATTGDSGSLEFQLVFDRQT